MLALLIMGKDSTSVIYVFCVEACMTFLIRKYMLLILILSFFNYPTAFAKYEINMNNDFKNGVVAVVLVKRLSAYLFSSHSTSSVFCCIILVI